MVEWIGIAGYIDGKENELTALIQTEGSDIDTRVQLNVTFMWDYLKIFLKVH